MRRAARTDANHSEVVREFRARGFSVLDLSRMGQGCPDLLVARAGDSWLIEIKDGNKPPSQRQLTPDERQFHDSWRGRVLVVKDIEDVAAVI